MAPFVRLAVLLALLLASTIVRVPSQVARGAEPELQVLDEAVRGVEARAFSTSGQIQPTTAPPNDPLLGEQYYFQKMEVLPAWALTRGSPDCLIGVIERGFDLRHPEFDGRRIRVFEIDGMEHPRDWIHDLHGTEIVGLMAAQTNNGEGIAGLAPACPVIVAKMGTHPSFRKRTTEGASVWNRLLGQKSAEAIRRLADEGCRVINCSYTTSTTPKDAFKYAIDHDVVVVIGSGNFNASAPCPPAGAMEVLSVGGVDRNDVRWIAKPRKVGDRTMVQGSNFGDGLNVVAPCTDMLVCMPPDDKIDAALAKDIWLPTPMGLARKGYLLRQGMGGTSYAAPMAAALATLIRSLRPDLNHRTVIRIVEMGADDLGEKGWDPETGHGRINFRKSLEIARDWPKTQ
jgi:subtilisin family serine protease